MVTGSSYHKEEKTSLPNQDKKKGVSVLKNAIRALLVTGLLMTNINMYAQKEAPVNHKKKPTTTQNISIPKVDHQKVIKMLPEVILQEYGQEKGMNLLREHMRIEINKVRKEYKKGEVVMDEYLNKKAQEYAQYMSENNSFSHYDKQGNGLDKRVNVDGNLYYPLNENLAFGILDITGVINNWMNYSPGHKATIIESKYNWGKVVFNRFGFGYKDGYYVLVLGGK